MNVNADNADKSPAFPTVDEYEEDNNSVASADIQFDKMDLALEYIGFDSIMSRD